MSVQAHPNAVEDGIDYGTGPMGGPADGRNGPVAEHRQQTRRSRPYEEYLRPYAALAPSPRVLAMLGVGGLGAAVGALAGGWLGGRRQHLAPRPIRKARARTGAAVALAPVAARLLANPIGRDMAIKMVMRQLSRRLPV